jgi:transposase
MDSQRLSEFAVRLGSENTWRRFYSQHLSFMSQYDNEHVVLIDSTGLPNNIKFPLSKISNHNGKISREVRLILLIDSRTGMPLYFQYIPGNVIDVTTLKTTLAEAEALGIDIRYVILDAGYYSEENIRLLIKANIPYIIRLKAGNNDYNYLFAKYRKNLDSGDHVINYNGRILHVRRVDYELFGHKTYAYVCIDYDRQRDEMKKYYIEATNKQLKSSTIKMETEKMGFFVLLSSKRLSKIEILPYYYARQTIEQVFDIGKNYADLIPLRVHNEETFRGHLMLSFLVTTIYLMTNHLLEDTKFSAKKAYTILETIHARVFRDRITIDEAIKDVNTILNCFKLKLPSIITNVDTSITTKLFESIQKSKK